MRGMLVAVSLAAVLRPNVVGAEAHTPRKPVSGSTEASEWTSDANGTTAGGVKVDGNQISAATGMADAPKPSSTTPSSTPTNSTTARPIRCMWWGLMDDVPNEFGSDRANSIDPTTPIMAQCYYSDVAFPEDAGEPWETTMGAMTGGGGGMPDGRVVRQMVEFEIQKWQLSAPPIDVKPIPRNFISGMPAYLRVSNWSGLGIDRAVSLTTPWNFTVSVRIVAQPLRTVWHLPGRKGEWIDRTCDGPGLVPPADVRTAAAPRTDDGCAYFPFQATDGVIAADPVAPHTTGAHAQLLYRVSYSFNGGALTPLPALGVASTAFDVEVRGVEAVGR